MHPAHCLWHVRHVLRRPSHVQWVPSIAGKAGSQVACVTTCMALWRCARSPRWATEECAEG
eukprot:11400035-Alexandrium_andersonii.AAC.1